MSTLSAIPITSEWIDKILSGEKTWEVRSKFTKKIGPVALIKSKSGTVVATATIVEVVGITPIIARSNAKKMGMTEPEALEEVGHYAWVLKDIIKLNKPIPYKHPYGAVTWVTLDEPTTKSVLAEAERSRR